jgi:hypothetical protein
MKTLQKLSLLLLLIGFLSACSSTKIQYDQSVDFSQYKTFAFYKKGIKHLKLPPKKKHFVLKTISDALIRKGFQKSKHPDLIINVFTDLHDRIDVYPQYYSPFYSRAYIEKSKEGTLFIDIIDLRKKKIIWSGSKYINLDGNDYHQLKKAIYKLLEKFPPDIKH